MCVEVGEARGEVKGQESKRRTWHRIQKGNDSRGMEGGAVVLPSFLPPFLPSFQDQDMGEKREGVPDRRNDTSKGAEAGTNKPRSGIVDRETRLVPGFTGGVMEE